MACEPTFPHFQYVDRVLAVISPFIEKHVSEACADYSSAEYPQQEYPEPALGCSFVAEYAPDNVVAYQESYGEHKSIPSYGYRTGKNLRTRIPDDIVEQHTCSVTEWVLLVRFSVCEDGVLLHHCIYLGADGSDYLCIFRS